MRHSLLKTIHTQDSGKSKFRPIQSKLGFLMLPLWLPSLVIGFYKTLNSIGSWEFVFAKLSCYNLGYNVIT